MNTLIRKAERMRNSSSHRRVGEGKTRLLVPHIPVPGEDDSTAVEADDVPRRHAELESALVKNLKKQVACLEMEVAVLKRAKEQGTHQGTLSADRSGMALERCDAGYPLNMMCPLTTSHVDPFAPWMNVHDERNGNENADSNIYLERQRRSLHHADTALSQLTIQRLRLEKESVEERLRSEQQEKEMLAAENVKLRAALRVSEKKEEELHQLHKYTLNALNTEQGKRRELEDKLSAVGTPNTKDNEETKSNKDIMYEKEYYRVQTDRLRVSLSEGLVRSEELEKQLRAERSQVATVEAKLRIALDEVQRLQRVITDKASVYERMDQHYIEVWTKLQMAIEDCDTLHEELRRRQGESSSPSSSGSIGETLRGLERISSGLKSGVLLADVSGGAIGMDTSDNVSKAAKSPSSFPKHSEPITTTSTSNTNTTNTNTNTNTTGVPPPPTASVPAPPTATVPPPPTASVPAPPTATVPPPPTASVPAPPPTATVPEAVPLQTQSNPVGVPQPPSQKTIDQELEEVERKIREEEEALLSYLKTRKA
ncbi:uncharacterized protein TM35_000112300 [Trypanosoma theileri]|uniref:Uncharacterized protein n=1 Tax=Trypanosoma theileri TaxID=67003 RepID=A0A1X0NYB6_9TRYP|nr:uncharacterized protein TM35_000112300 [Trypanosoma theileri]ORC89696.1 hypothetical protein TM35_000112300 [Trypanosoma theileri]